MYVHQDNMNSFHFISYSYYTVGIFAQENGRGEVLFVFTSVIEIKNHLNDPWFTMIIDWVLEYNVCES